MYEIIIQLYLFSMIINFCPKMCTVFQKFICGIIDNLAEIFA